MSNGRHAKGPARWIAIAAAALLVLVAAGLALNRFVSRMIRDRAMQALRDDFGGQLKLKNLSVTVFPHFQLWGEGLTVRYQGRTDLPPLVQVRKFSADGDVISALSRHIRHARLDGLEIQVPPKSERTPRQKQSRTTNHPSLVIDEIETDNAVLRTLPKKADQEPLVWEIRHLTLHDAGASSPMPFRATLVNAKPPGDIETTGKFGPWQTDEPRSSPLDGSYQFRNADLSVFKGIAGILSSQGNFRGVLERIEVQGSTDTPDFAVKVSGNPVHLTTEFHAVVDGTDGDTLLQPVNARFGRSSVVARGGVVETKGEKDKTISLDVVVQDGRLQDLLRLAVKGKPTMTGAVSFRAKLVIPPGDVDVAKKIRLDGQFTAASAHFSNTDIQQKVNQLSHRGQGEPKAPPTGSVASDFTGRFRIAHGMATFEDLAFRVPGVRVALRGSYDLMNQQMDFHGDAKLEAKLSQTTTGFKSFLLKAVDPFFKKNGAGADLPIKVTGTRDQPSFGLELKRHKP